MMRKIIGYGLSVFIVMLVSSQVQAQRARTEDVIQGFIDGVYLYCLPYVKSNISFTEELYPDAPSQIVPASENRIRDPQLVNWVIADIGELVLLEAAQDHSECTVSSIALPVDATFDAVGMRIQMDDVAFQHARSLNPHPLVFFRGYVLSEDGRNFTITLSGNEPGAPGTRSRYSTLIATVAEVEELPIQLDQ